MKKEFLLLVCLLGFNLLFAQTVHPLPDILNLLSVINPDTMQAHVQHLQNYQTRYALAGNQLEIATWISEQFQGYGFTNTYMQQYPHFGTTQYNVIATIPGYMYPDRYIIVGGHYDSQSLNSSNMAWAPGADDNAIGTAGLLEMARVMKSTGYQPRCSIRFIAISAEEGNGWGSEAYCDQALSENQDIRVMVNLDMIASNQPVTNEFCVIPFTGSLIHCAEAIAISEHYTTLQPVEGQLDLGGDSVIFSQAGYHTVFFMERYISPYWHTGEDVIDHLDFEYARQIMRAATATTAVFANQPDPIEAVTVSDTGTGSSLLVEWVSSPDPEVSQYAVYYGTETDAMVFWQNVSDTQCLISGLVDGQYYHVAVAAVNSAGYSSIRTYSGETSLSVPRVPQLQEDLPGTGSITITWLPNTELDLAAYNVHRCLGPEGTDALIGTATASETSFTDTDVSSNLEYYYYRISAVDTQGQQSQLSEALTSRVVSLDRGILVIDESKNFGGTSPFMPTDQAVDGFYAGLLEDYAQVEHLDLEEYSGSLRVADIGVYSSILWHGNDNSDYVYPFQCTDVLRQYINLGGQVLFSVYFPSKAFELNAGYPATFPEDSFMNEVLGIGGVRYSSGARFKSAIACQPNYPSLQIDSLKTMASWQGHIIGVEGLEPVNSADGIYLYASDYSPDSNQGVLIGSSVGVWHQYGAGQVLCLSFPLYNMKTSGATALTDYVFGTLFEEPVETPGYSETPVAELKIMQNYPNPFTQETTFRVETSDTRKLLLIRIYNLRGQLIQTLYHGYPQAITQYIWNGRDAEGKCAVSGIYFIKATSGDDSVISKILKMP